MKKQLIFPLLLIGSVGYSQTTEKEVIASSGDSFKNANHSLEFSIGETASSNHENSSTQLAEGFHSGELNITSTFLAEKNLVNISVYPNPTTNNINIETSENNLTFKLLTLEGKVLVSRQLNSQNNSIDVSSFSTGTYISAIYNNNQLINESKIIKQ